MENPNRFISTFQDLFALVSKKKIDIEEAVTRWQAMKWPDRLSPHKKVRKLREEVNELIEAIDEYTLNPCAATRKHVQEEAADVGILLVAILTLIGLRLDHAMYRKLASNLERAMGKGKPIRD